MVGRMSAAEKAAQIKEQLAAKSIEQAAIAEQAIKAIENGLDPKIAAELALAASNEVSEKTLPISDISKNNQTEVISAENIVNKWEMVKVIAEDRAKTFCNTSSIETGPYQFFTDDNGEALVPKPIANIICHPNAGFALAE